MNIRRSPSQPATQTQGKATKKPTAARPSPKNQSQKARKPTGRHKITPVISDSSSDSSSSADTPKAPPKKGRKSSVRQIALPDSNTSSKFEPRRPVRTSNQNDSVQKSQSPSTSVDPSQPGCSWFGTQNTNGSPNNRKTQDGNSYSRSQNIADEELTASYLDNLVNKCVSFILVADQKKYAIKKQDIIKNVFEHHDSKLYKTVLDKACNILKKTFGLEILGIENRKNEYLLINILDTREFAEYSAVDLQKQGLVFYLLTLIYMNENVINEDDLWKALEPLGIDVNSRVPHLIFGDVKKYITGELVKQMYLEHRCISKDPLHYEFVWGQRAKQEVCKTDLLSFACKVMGDTQPADWKYQFNDASTTEGTDSQE